MTKKALLGRAALFATAFIWGTSFVIMKGTLDEIGALWVLALRFTIAAILLILLSRKRLRSMNRTAVKGSLLMGSCLAIAYIVQTYGLVYTTPGKNAFLTATYCVLVPFLAWGIYRRRPGLANVIAAILCVSGIGLVSLGNGFHDVNVGDILTLFCGVFYAFQIILMEQYGPESDALCISTVQFAAAAVICWVGALVFEKAPSGVGLSSWANIGYLGVMCTAVCFFLQAWGMKYTPSAPAAVIQTLESVFGALISVLFFNEPITVKLFFGFALIFVSVIISETDPAFLKFSKKR